MNPVADRQYQLASDFWGQNAADEQWRLVLTGEDPALRRYRSLFAGIPSKPRCKLCNAPFRGPGSLLMRVFGRTTSRLNPHFCRVCLETTPVGGAEIYLTMLFADVRGSTTLAEQMSPGEFGRLINRFYVAAAEIFTQSDAIVSRLVGDEVVGLYVSGFAGEDHARSAIAAAQQLLVATGHGRTGQPWIPIGAGVHSGNAYVGKVGTEDVADLTVLGDAANITSRLASLAATGEILISEAAYVAAGSEPAGLKRYSLEVKGRVESVDIRVLSAASD